MRLIWVNIFLLGRERCGGGNVLLVGFVRSSLREEFSRDRQRTLDTGLRWKIRLNCSRNFNEIG
jgi:hypothetical protein